MIFTKEIMKMNNHLVITVLAPDQPGITNELSSLAASHQCNIQDSRMGVFGSEFALIMMLTGSWDSIAKFENSLKQLESKKDYLIQYKRTEINQVKQNLMPYNVEVVALDSPGIIKDITDFFANQLINIENLVTETYKAPHTAAQMIMISMTVNISFDIQIADLREQFMIFCDELNLDATIEPIKGHM